MKYDGESAGFAFGKNTYVSTQWGVPARPFSSYQSEEKDQLLGFASRLVTDLKNNVGVDLIISYGVLLGYAREGDLIPHDFDIDLVFLCRKVDDVYRTCRDLCESLVDRGFTLESESNGHIKAFCYEFGTKLVLEFFAGWVSNNKFFQYFAIPGSVDVSAVLPLSEISICGHSFPAPRDPSAVLEAIYGADWRVPNPQFAYEMSASDWVPFKFLFSKQEGINQHWEAYYSPSGGRSAPEHPPSPFAIIASTQFSEGSLVMDFGCGNGRDSIHFLRCGCAVVAIDLTMQSLDIVGELADREGYSVDLKQLNLWQIPEATQFEMQYAESADYIYARFFTHAITDLALINFRNIARKCLKKGGQLWLEFRVRPEVLTENDFLMHETFSTGNHFRRIRTMLETKSFFWDSDFSTLQSVEAHGLAIFGEEDPLVGRLVLSRL